MQILVQIFMICKGNVFFGMMGDLNVHFIGFFLIPEVMCLICVKHITSNTISFYLQRE